MPKRKTKLLKKSDCTAFLAKSEQFLATMEEALQLRHWDSAALQAVHAVISASDAVIVFYGGVRSTDPDHRAVVGLLEDILGAEASSASRHVVRVIARKNTVEYEQRRLTEKEAQEMAEHARRFLKWANKMLPASN